MYIYICIYIYMYIYRHPKIRPRADGFRNLTAGYPEGGSGGPQGPNRAHRGPIGELYIKLYIILYRALWAHMGPFGLILGPWGP